MSGFADVFGRLPEARASAPGRVNLLGEHTDYNDGYVLPTAIPQQTVVSMARNGGNAFVVHAAELGREARFTLAEAPDAHFATYVRGCIRGIAALGVAVPCLDIHVASEVPIGVGLSSSAALEVATLRALRSLLDITTLDDVAVAQLAQRAEIEDAGVHCGIMDQMASSLADTAHMLFLDTRTLERQLLPLPAGTGLLVLDSGIARSLAGTAYNERRAECNEAARRLGVPTLRDVDSVTALDSLPDVLRARARHVVTENARVLQARAGVDATVFGALMDASHASLRDDYAVSVPELDQLVALLQAQPAVYGARLTGAGFGGACVALCENGATAGVAAAVLAAYASAGHTGGVLVPPPGAAQP